MYKILITLFILFSTMNANSIFYKFEEVVSDLGTPWV